MIATVNCHSRSGLGYNHADGNGTKYEYDARGRLTKRTRARGVDTPYTYDAWGNLVTTAYSDNTPTVTLAYDAMGRQTRAVDAAGITTFAYDSFGSLTNETVVGVAGTNTIERFYDAFGRDTGYALNGVRQSTLAYDAATGRLATMQAFPEEANHHSSTSTSHFNSFRWSYLPGSDLKSSLAYPNGLTASWTYGNRGELLEVNNASPTGTISRYAYTYDAAGRRIACAKSGTAFEQSDSVNYGYNARSELTSATAAVDSDYSYGYNFDDIGNRKTSSERGTNSVYTASQLNQYTTVDDFTPTYDADGNETLVKTATGIWQVSYNGENRPVRWELVSSNSNTPNSNTQTLLRMSFDRMGRRVTKNDQRFVYNGYLQIANHHSSTSTSHFNYYIWDPTEPVATRPLAWLVLRSLGEGGQRGTSVAYYTHDGNKNVSEVIASNNDVAAHYEYAPFGALTISRGVSAAANPFRFSSEYAEDDTATVYYNYRHYEPVTGRWMARDPIFSMHYALWRKVVDRARVMSLNLYAFVDNACVVLYDKLGLVGIEPSGFIQVKSKCCLKANGGYRTVVSIFDEPCCGDGETEARPSECTCRSCGERVVDKVDGYDGCIGDANMDGYGDAFRHCLASCVMAKTCGTFCAFLGGWGHELSTPTEFFGSGSWQDVSNNSKGRDLAKSGKDCVSGCLDLLYGGNLTVFNKRNLPDPRDKVQKCIREKCNPL